jgi:hypothetical protein
MAGRIEHVDFVETLKAALDTVTAEETSIRSRLDDLQTERRGLELALRRYTIQEPLVSGSYAAGTKMASVDDLDTTTEEQAAERVGEVAEAEEAEEAERPDPSEVRQPEATMTDTVTEILRQATGPMGPKDVVDALERIGQPQEDSVQVRGTLGYLNRKGLLRKLGRGAWVLKGSPADRAHQDDDIFADVDVPRDAETPTADAAGVSVNEVRVEGGQYQPAAMAG